MNPGIDGRNQDMVRLESDIDGSGIAQAAQKEPGCHQEHHRHGHLYHNEGVAHAKAPAAGDVGRAGFEDGGDVGAGGAQRGNQPEEQSSYRDEQSRKCKHAHVDVEIEFDGQGYGKLEAGKRARGPACEQKAQSSAQHGEQRALSEQLRHQPAPGRAQGHANRNLLLPAGRPRQQQIAHVGAHHQQQSADDHHENSDEQSGRSLRSRNQIAGGLQGHRLGMLLTRPILLIQLPHNDVDSALGLGAAYARLEARVEHQPVIVPLAFVESRSRKAGLDGSCHGQRNPELGHDAVLGAFKPGWRHSHHRVRFSIEHHFMVQDCGIAAEPAPPKAVPQNHHRGAALRRVLLGYDCQSRGHPQSQHGKEVSAYRLSPHTLRRT